MLNDLNPRDFKNIYIVCGFTDMRYGINGLSAIIEQRYKMDVFKNKTLFMFCGHNARLMKALLWEGDGFLLLTKRLEGGHFCWPRTSTDVRNLTPEQFRWLMQGFAIDPQIKTVYPKHCA